MDQVIRAVILVLFGALVTHLWNRFRGKPTLLRWTDQYVRLAVSTDAALATVEVLYNGAPVTNLYLASVQFQNESNTDLQNVIVNLACLEGSRILLSEGNLAGSLQSLPFAPAFDQALTTAIQNPAQANWAYLNTRRDYLVPVFNRGALTNFVLLLTRDDLLEPRVQLACDHVGARVIHQPAVWVLWGIPMKQGIIVGVIAGLALALAVSLNTSSPLVAALFAWLIGLTSSFIGVAILRAWRWLTRLMG